MVKRRTAVRFRAYPTGEQQQQVIRTIGCARLVYNLMLESRNAKGRCLRMPALCVPGVLTGRVRGLPCPSPCRC